MAGRGITRVSSPQTAVTSWSLRGPAGDVPGHSARPKSECTEEDGFTQSLHEPWQSPGISPELQLLRPHYAYKRTFDGQFCY